MRRAPLGPLPAGFTVTAHSGAFGTPENSLEFVERVLREDCDIIEMDVTFRPDGTPVILHCGSPAQNEGVPLAEALQRIAADPRLRMNLDLKSVANLPAVDALLKEYGLLGRAFYTGVDEAWTETVRSNSAVPYYLNTGVSYAEKRSAARADRLAKKLLSLGAVGLNTHYGNATPTVAAAMHANGLPVSLWTANTRAAMLRCLRLGADNITTRQPDQLKKLTEGLHTEA